MAKESKEPLHGGTHPTATPPRLDAHELPEHLKQAQAQAAEQPPKPVKLESAKDEYNAPRDAPPVPPAAKPEPVPRVIDQSERSPDPQKFTRYKVRADQPFGAQPTRYVLARKGDKQGAIDHYLQTTGIRAILDTYPEGQAPRPLMVVRELVD